MRKDFPDPYIRSKTEDKWFQLTLGLEPIIVNHRPEPCHGSITASLWPFIFNQIPDSQKNSSLIKPETIAQFHLRRTCSTVAELKANLKREAKREAKRELKDSFKYEARLKEIDSPEIFKGVSYTHEILRVEKNFLTLKIREQLRLEALNQPSVICAGWWSSNMNTEYPPEFLSFLHQLSVLRGRVCDDQNKIYPKYLGECKDHFEANKIMHLSGESWSEALALWIPFLDKNFDPKFPNFRARFEYPHWFGHIFTGSLS